MGINERQWIVRPVESPEKAARLATELGIDRVLADLLVQRGVETFEQARSFFRPRLEDLHDPFLMKDMDKAVERVHQAVTGGQKILVYGDYDVDGSPTKPWTGPETTESTWSSPWTAASRPLKKWSMPAPRE